MKISEAQIKLLQLMDSGWQLGTSSGITSRTWLQKGGCGKGGESRRVNTNTKHALWEKGLIELDKIGFPTTTWKLTEQGKSALTLFAE